MQILDARQLGLKFICNVTYGYASASYSGRMPAVEIADSIVQSGRETLEKVWLSILSHIRKSTLSAGRALYQLFQEVGSASCLRGYRFTFRLPSWQDKSPGI
jgi:DNA polymerase family B